MGLTMSGPEKRECEGLNHSVTSTVVMGIEPFIFLSTGIDTVCEHGRKKYLSWPQFLQLAGSQLGSHVRGLVWTVWSTVLLPRIFVASVDPVGLSLVCQMGMSGVVCTLPSFCHWWNPSAAPIIL